LAYPSGVFALKNQISPSKIEYPAHHYRQLSKTSAYIPSP
jgi:hypothetical protein